MSRHIHFRWKLKSVDVNRLLLELTAEQLLLLNLFNGLHVYHLLSHSRYAAVPGGAISEHGGQSKQIPSVSKTWSHFLFRVVLLVIIYTVVLVKDISG
jgi:hypothetical protein